MPTGKSQGGFTYIGLLLLIAIMGVALAATGMLYRTQAQREKEKELLFVGDQFRRAIKLYYEKSPGGDKRYPKSLGDLLRDQRYPGVQRYLRKIYVDPMTGSTDWGLVAAPAGGIAGVHSLSEQTPMKTAEFSEADAGFTGTTSYADWKFSYLPPPPQSKKTQQDNPQQAPGQQQEPAQQ